MRLAAVNGRSRKGNDADRFGRITVLTRTEGYRSDIGQIQHQPSGGGPELIS